MAQYEVSTNPLISASESINSIASKLQNIHGQMETICAEIPTGMHDLKRSISIRVTSVQEALRRTSDFGKALAEVADAYAYAEQNAFNDTDLNRQEATTRSASATIVTEKRNSVVFTDSVPMPDWLKAAVIKFEQGITEVK